jgi:hypothetical protein
VMFVVVGGLAFREERWRKAGDFVFFWWVGGRTTERF